MKNKCLRILILFLLPCWLTAQEEFQITYVKPYEMTTSEGKNVVKARIETDGIDYSVFLNGKQIPASRPAGGILEVLLPLTGEEAELRFSSPKNRMVSRQVFRPLVPADWGYFGKGRIHIICSSHQDIAWMNTPDSCREERIHDIVRPALDQIDRNPDFRFEMEQTLNLMEVLDAVPSERQRILDAGRKGRFTWGATFNQPYEGLESSEQLVRQTYFGRKWIKDNLPGMDALAAYNVDVPGRTLQMPQILEKSGIKYLVISRMKEGFYNWYSPDGSRVLTYSPGNYGWALLVRRYFEGDVIAAFQKLNKVLKDWDEYYRFRNLPPEYGVIISTDAGGPKDYTPLIQEWNAIASSSGSSIPMLRHSTGEEFLREIDVPHARMDSISGERPNLWLYIHGPAHYQAIKAKKAAAVTLPAAEMFSSISSIEYSDMHLYPASEIQQGWYDAIYPDHGWGGKHGEITDSIFRASLEKGNRTGTSILGESLSRLSARIDTQKPGAIIVFNDLSWPRSGPVSIDMTGRKGSAWGVADRQGNTVPSCMERDGSALTFTAENVPSLGYKTWYVTRDGKTQTAPAATHGSNFCENRFYRVLLGSGGITGLYDKELNKQVLNTTRYAGGDVLHFGYNGNGAGEFVRITPVNYKGFESLSMKQQRWKLRSATEISSVYEASAAMSNFTVVQRVIIYHREKRIDVQYDIPDWPGAQNRQIRAVFPLAMKEAQVTYDVPMGIVNVDQDELNMSPRGWSWEGTYRQMPREIHPREIENFISASSTDFGFTLSTDLAVADWIDPGRESVDYPVLQGVMLSSHKSVHGLGNWYHQKGSHSFRFSFSSHKPGWRNGYQFGVEGNHPLLPVFNEKPQRGSLPEEAGFIRVSDPLVRITTFKKDEKSNSFILRFVNMDGVEKTIDVSLWIPAHKLIKTNIIEEDVFDTGLSGREFTLVAGKNAIETYRIALN